MLPKKWGSSHGQKHRPIFIGGHTHRANRLAQGSGDARATSSSVRWEIPGNFAPNVAKLWISMEFEVDPCGGGHGAHEKRSTGSQIFRRHCPRGSSRSRRNLCRVHDRGRDWASAPAAAREKAKEVKVASCRQHLLQGTLVGVANRSTSGGLGWQRPSKRGQTPYRSGSLQKCGSRKVSLALLTFPLKCYPVRVRSSSKIRPTLDKLGPPQGRKLSVPIH